MGSTCSGCMSTESSKTQSNIPESNSNLIIGDEKPDPDQPLDPPKIQKPPRKALIKKKKLEKITEAKSAKIISRVKSDQDLIQLLTIMNSSLILKNIDEACKKVVIDSMKWYYLEAKEIVYQESNPGECFFIVSSGRLEVLEASDRVKVLKSGDFFGEEALIDDRPRTNTIRTLEKTSLWVIDRNSYKRALEAQSATQLTETLEFMSSVPILQTLTNEQKLALISEIRIENYPKDSVIFREGEPGDTLHIIKEGQVNVVLNNMVLRTMAKGCFYGEQALIAKCPRTADIIAATQLAVLVIKRDSLLEVFGTNIEEIIFKNTIKLCLEKTSILKATSNLQDIISLIRTKKYTIGETVIKKGTRKAQFLMIVVKGKLRSETSTIEAYEILGENDMKKNSKDRYAENYLAEIDSVVAEISKKKLEKFMDTKVHKFSSMNELLLIMQKVNLFRCLSDQKLKTLVKLITEVKFANDEKIITEGEVGDKLFIIKSGSVNAVKNNEIKRTLNAGSFFGERAIILNEPRSATIIAAGPVTCWVLTKEGFNRIVDAKMNKIIVKRIELQDDSIGLSDLIPIKVAGRGTHGIVYLCAHKEKKSLYALKSVTRQKIEAYELQESLLSERNILMQLEHLMIVKLVKTFKDNLRVYFLMEFIKGIDLFDLQGKFNIFPNEDCKFYASTLLIILDFLHNNEIIYRDLKPENIFVDSEGYLKLIDFGSAKIVKGKTYSILGTPHYMAPEIMTGTGYTSSVDWWSLGILLYEMHEGVVPFGVNDEDPIKIYEKVMEHNLVFTKINSNEVRAIIQQLLSNKPGVRNSGSVSRLKSHEYFNDVNWEAILSRQVKPRYIPKDQDFSPDISRAFKTKKNLIEFINREEASEFIVRSGSKPSKNFSDWDLGFV